jgi:putative ABC transport system substrate-binding protein
LVDLAICADAQDSCVVGPGVDAVAHCHGARELTLTGRDRTPLAATSTPANRVAKAATTTIPIVFTTSSDPVELGLVASLSRPGGNVTGIATLNVEVGSKRLELLCEIVPAGALIIDLFNPTNPNLET